jgi:short-subunit dehydrogenase
MKNKNIWIIGASFGIGEELANTLGLNNNIAISGRTLSKLEQLRSNLNKNYNHLALQLDVLDENSIQIAYNNIILSWGFIDIIIYASGVYTPGSFKDLDLHQGLQTIDTNLNGALRVISIALPNMLAKNSGHIVLISSASAYTGLPNSGYYGVSKAGLLYYAQTLKADLSKTNIKVQVVNPGFVDTRLTQKNNFKMPFLLNTKQASNYIINKLSSNVFDICFPKPLIFIIKLLKILPNSLYFFLIKKL